MVRLGEHPNDVTLRRAKKRIAELEAAMLEIAHQLMTLATAHEGALRNRLCTASNRLNAALGRQQSLHGERF